MAVHTTEAHRLAAALLPALRRSVAACHGALLRRDRRPASPPPQGARSLQFERDQEAQVRVDPQARGRRVRVGSEAGPQRTDGGCAAVQADPREGVTGVA